MTANGNLSEAAKILGKFSLKIPFWAISHLSRS